MHNEYQVWLIHGSQVGLDWDQYKALIEPKLESGITDFINTPLKLVEYSREGGFLKADDENYYGNIHKNRKKLEPKLREAFSLKQISKDDFAIICDFSKLLPVVADRKQLDDKYLFDYTDDELALNEMYEVVNEVHQKFQLGCYKPTDGNYENPDFVKLMNVANDAKFVQVNDLSEIKAVETPQKKIKKTGRII